MAQKLKVISLGGLLEIGKNITIFEFGSDIIIVDVGVSFPDDDMFGIDLVIPDFSYIVANRKKVRGIFLTHGHEDHIGAIPFLLDEISAPIYTTRLTAALVEHKLSEKHPANPVDINVVEPGDVVESGCFSVEFINVNHSIADSCALAIKSPSPKGPVKGKAIKHFSPSESISEIPAAKNPTVCSVSVSV